MTRREKYPDTHYFHYYNANPKNKFTDDCVIRAICTALEQDYVQTVREMTELGIAYGYLVNSDETINRYLKSKGWVKCRQPRKWDNTKFTGKEWCENIRWHESNVRMERQIANIGGHHIVAIIDGKINDIWDCSNKCIGNYWIKG